MSTFYPNLVRCCMGSNTTPPFFTLTYTLELKIVYSLGFPYSTGHQNLYHCDQLVTSKNLHYQNSSTKNDRRCVISILIPSEGNSLEGSHSFAVLENNSISTCFIMYLRFSPPSEISWRSFFGSDWTKSFRSHNSSTSHSSRSERFPSGSRFEIPENKMGSQIAAECEYTIPT